MTRYPSLGQGLAQPPECRVLDVEVVQLTDCGTHIGSLEQWNSTAQREQQNAVDREYYCIQCKQIGQLRHAAQHLRHARADEHPYIIPRFP